MQRERMQQVLLVFTRYPESGRVKTRLLPALGPSGAAALHQAMTTQLLQGARLWQAAAGEKAAIVVCFDGGDVDRMAACFGPELQYQPQCDGNLGARMQQAIHTAFAAGAASVVVVGSDCPALGPGEIAGAFDVLEQQEVVLGPTTDGGYYLIGMRQPLPELFPEQMPWGTDTVFTETVACLEAAGLGRGWACLPRRKDVDLPEDLPEWERQRRDPATDRPPRLSVVIPVLDEDRELDATLTALREETPPEAAVEVIVVDGGSQDATRDIARQHGVLLLQSPPGRARQMNRGAAVAQGECLLFLHGDTHVPTAYLASIERSAAAPGFGAGAFQLQLRGSKPGLRWIAAAANLRSRLLQRPYGDQGLFMKRSDFMALGGYRELPVMEDLDLVARLRCEGSRIMLADQAVQSSGRRWETHGLWRTTWAHQKMLLAWRLGLDPDKIRKLRH